MFRITRKIAVISGTALAGAALAGGTAYAATASSTPPPARIGCVTTVDGQSRVLATVYENVPANFKCPSGFAVSLSGAGTTGPAGPQGKTGPAGPAGSSGPAYYSEVDNDAEWALSSEPSAADTSVSGATYADAGVVVPLGELSKVTAADLAVDSTGGSVGVNLWVGNGAEASTPQVNEFSAEPNGADFCYLAYDSSAGTFSPLDSDCGSFGLSGSSITLAQVQAAFADSPVQAYAWAGESVSSNARASAASISTVGGTQVGATVGIGDNGGVLTPYVND